MVGAPSLGMIKSTKGSLSMQGVNAFISYEFVKNYKIIIQMLGIIRMWNNITTATYVTNITLTQILL